MKEEMYMDNLKETCLFHEITNEEISKMLTCAKSVEKKYAAGTYIFRQEEKPFHLFLLLKGSVCIAKDFPSGKRDILYMIEEGNVFGEIFLFGDREKYWYDAVANEDSVVLMIPWDFFYHFCENACHHHQLLTRNMLDILSQKDFMITKKLHIISTASLRERIAIWLVDAMDQNGRVVLQMNRETLADFLGVARPSLSRELGRMQDDGLIQVEKKEIRVIDRDAMEELY